MVRPLWIDRSDGNGQIRNPDLTDEEFNAGIEQMRLDNLQALWAAATDYQRQQIDGAAIGLLSMGTTLHTLGAKQCPKCLAVMAWIQTIWGNSAVPGMGLYYDRKPLITYNSPASLFDFSSCGPMPYSVPELQVEVLG